MEISEQSELYNINQKEGTYRTTSYISTDRRNYLCTNLNNYWNRVTHEYHTDYTKKNI